MPGLPRLVSADGPTQNEVALVSSAPRFQHFLDVEVATEANKIIAPSEVSLPSACARVVFVVDEVGELVGDVRIVSAIDPSVRQHRFGLWRK